MVQRKSDDWRVRAHWPVHVACHRRLRSGRYPAVFLAACFFHIHLPEPGNDQALFRTYGLQELKQQEIEGCAYHVTDLPVLGSLGGENGYIAVLVLMLYINSEDVRLLYSRTEVLWLLCPLLLYLV